MRSYLKFMAKLFMLFFSVLFPIVLSVFVMIAFESTALGVLAVFVILVSYYGSFLYLIMENRI